MAAAIGVALSTILCAILTIEWAGSYDGAAAFAVLVTILLCSLAMASRKRAPRSAGIAAGIALAWTAPVAFVAYDHLTRPIDAVDAPLHSGFLVLAFGGIAPVVAFAGGGLAIQRSFDRVRRMLAWTCALVGCAFFLVSALRPARADRDEFPRAMPVVGELVAGGRALSLGAISIDVTVEPRSTVCRVHVASYQGYESFFADNARVSYCPPVRVRHDAVDGVALIEVHPIWNTRPLSQDAAWETLAIQSTRDGRPLALDARAFRSSIRVPLHWTAGVAFATAFAFVLLFVARRLRVRADALDALVDAEHEGEGWFVLADGERIRVPLATALAKGPFAVRLEGRGEEAYRRSAAATIDPICAGSVEENAARVRDFAGSCEGVALAAVAIGAMPAAVALSVLLS